MTEYFSRQQAIEISGLSSGQLSRLDRSGIVRPKKLGSSAHPTVLYDRDQIVELKVVAALRCQLSIQEISKVIESIRQLDSEDSLFGKFLVIAADNIYWILPEDIGVKIASIVEKNDGRAVFKIVNPLTQAIEV